MVPIMDGQRYSASPPHGDQIGATQKVTVTSQEGSQPGAGQQNTLHDHELHGFQDGISSKGRRQEDHADCRAQFLGGLRQGTKHRHLVAAVIKGLPTLSWSDPCHEFRAMVERGLGMAGTEVPHNAVTEDACVDINEDGHDGDKWGIRKRSLPF